MSVPGVRGFIDDKLAIEMIQHLFEQPQITAALVLTMSSALVLAQVLEEEGVQTSVRGCAFSYANANANEPGGPQELAALTAVLFKDKIVPLYGQVGWLGWLQRSEPEAYLDPAHAEVESIPMEKIMENALSVMCGVAPGAMPKYVEELKEWARRECAGVRLRYNTPPSTHESSFRF